MIDSNDPIWDAIVGITRLGAMATMAELGCADHLAGGPMSVTELAGACGAHAPSLARVMRELAGIGIVRTVGPGVYELTESGQALREGVPGSMRAALRVMLEPGYWHAMGTLPEAVRLGRSPFIERFGTYYDYLEERPEAARNFNDYMGIRAASIEPALAAAYDFSGCGTLVDVAGGRGHLLAAVLDANPRLRGVLLDREGVVAHAREALATRGFGDRCEFVGGDFFEAVPEGADAYLLASIIHNWDDDDALRILGNVRDAMAGEGRVLLLEMVLPDDDSPHIGKEIDLRMLTLLGGRERTRSEYATLLGKSGLSLSRVLPLPAGASLIEALPV